MLRRSAGFHRSEGPELTDGALRVAQGGEQPDPNRMTKATEELGLEQADRIEPRGATFARALETAVVSACCLQIFEEDRRPRRGPSAQLREETALKLRQRPHGIGVRACVAIHGQDQAVLAGKRLDQETDVPGGRRLHIPPDRARQAFAKGIELLALTEPACDSVSARTAIGARRVAEAECAPATRLTSSPCVGR